MNDRLEKMSSGGLYGIPSTPFICRNIPNAAFNAALFCPSIRINLPFVGNHRNSGFTLIELMVTLAVLAIAVAFAAPNMRGFIQNQRITTLTNDLILDISTARSEALRRATQVVVCSSSSGTACDGGANWVNGRFIFADLNSNGIFDAVGDEAVRSREGTPNNTLTTVGIPDPLIYNARGLVTPQIAGAASFTLCDDRGAAYGKTVQISGTGQPRVNANPPAGC